MLQKLILLLLILLSGWYYSQQVIGKVTNDAGKDMPGVAVVNIRTGNTAWTDKFGQFFIDAVVADELRFVRKGYERQNIKLSQNSFSRSLDVVLQLQTEQIEEVTIAFRPSGDLKKDIQQLRQPERVVALNRAANNWMRQVPNELPAANSIPSAFAQRNLSAGQLPIASIGSGAAGLIGMLAKAIFKPATKPGTPTFVETEKFYRQVKHSVDMAYFQKYGMDEYAFEKYLIYADKTFNLTKRYARNYNAAEIESILKSGLQEYLSAHKV